MADRPNCFEEGIHCFCMEPCLCFPRTVPVKEPLRIHCNYNRCESRSNLSIDIWAPRRRSRTYQCSKHYAQRTQERFSHHHRMDDTMNASAKILRCKPDEVLENVLKIQAQIKDMQNTLRKEHVSLLISLNHADCTKHEAPCKRCEKCSRFDCDKCRSVDYLRTELGLEPLLKK